ncbi:MAG: hypothetical protein LBB55_07090 [Zoogloeaceae bacterium]|nr:hypothetical protein [Zoogloeaceae bacterium]
MVQTIQGGAQRVALRKVRRFVQANPDWNLRVYRTPLGLRVLATHRPFLPSDPQVAHCFSALGADPMYRKMCLLQQCFRARVSAKPWRIGVKTRMKPRPGLWPVRPERLAERAAWIEKYETVAKRFAACHFIEQYGSGQEHADVEPVRVWHDELCRALEARLPLA